MVAVKLPHNVVVNIKSSPYTTSIGISEGVNMYGTVIIQKYDIPLFWIREKERRRGGEGERGRATMTHYIIN